MSKREKILAYTKRGVDRAIAKAIAAAVAALPKPPDLSGYATKEDLAKVAAGGKIDLSEYAKKTDMAGLATRAELASYAPAAALAGYAQKGDLADVARTSDLAGLATKAELADVARTSDLAGLATKAEIADVAHTSDLQGLATREDLERGLAAARIRVVATEKEAADLPDGALYFLAAPAPGGDTPAPPEDGPQVVSHTAGQSTGQSIDIALDGQEGDRVIIAVNTKAVSGSAITFPSGFRTLIEPYYIGTMRWVLASGPWAAALAVTASTNLEMGFAAVCVRGGGTPMAGQVKKRQAEPVETTTVTAPDIPGTKGLAIGFAFERTSAAETSDQVTVSGGWERLDYAAQQGANYQTVLVARRTAASGDLTVTYPNAQGSNGAGVQVVIPHG
ncbi:hypothetical protein QU668_03805 [Schaalia sp. HMT-877]|nr:hypothetical protein HMPREF1550_00182 [Actinomyces sp. oral taxon 877 str. F0543]WLD80871.1 hypothetical protein QU668_03805 [Schaalia sp. HMT-877]